MRNRLAGFALIIILSALFIGCDLGLANDPEAKAILASELVAAKPADTVTVTPAPTLPTTYTVEVAETPATTTTYSVEVVETPTTITTYTVELVDAPANFTTYTVEVVDAAE